MISQEPKPEDLAPAEWAYWSDEQKYVYLERIGMGAAHAIAVKQARAIKPPPQPRLFA